MTVIIYYIAVTEIYSILFYIINQKPLSTLNVMSEDVITKNKDDIINENISLKLIKDDTINDKNIVKTVNDNNLKKQKIIMKTNNIFKKFKKR